MKYVLLIHNADAPNPDDPKAWARLLERQQHQVATTVRLHEGQTLVTDGRFVEMKEALDSYLFYEAEDDDAAIELAARIPAGRLGGAVEIRRLV